MNVYVNYQDARWEKVDVDFARVVELTAGKKYHSAEVDITLTDDDEIHGLNKQYRNIDRPTNVLSFELGDDILLGDIFISYDTVAREAAAMGISIRAHTIHMVVHGVLHLLGYDHINDADAVIMESKEIEVLKKMGIENPYADDDVIQCANGECCPGGKFISWFKKIKIRENGFWQYALYFLCGAIASFGFAPFYMWGLTCAGIGLAYYLTVRNESNGGIWKNFLRVFPFSATYSIGMFWWMLNSIYVVPELRAQFAIWTIPGIVGIGILGGIIFAIPFVAIRAIRTNPAYRAILFACVWALVLWAREWMLTGFPWNPISNIMMPYPMISNSMSVWGALGLTFIIIGLIASIVDVVRTRKRVSSWGVMICFAWMFACGAIVGHGNIMSARVGMARSDRRAPVIRVVQPARAQSDKMVYSHADAVRRAHENIDMLVDMAAASQPVDLIVFPETTYPFVIDNDYIPMAKRLGKNIVFGATTYRDGKLYNSMVVANSDGMVERVYDKSHLVPFGEYGPLGFLPSPVNLTSGGGAELISLNVDGVEFIFAPAICYEIIFSDSLIPRTGLMPDMIINITNDTWFGNTPGTYQHLDMVRRYAIESGLPIVRANYSGISAIVLSNGEILSALGIGQRGVLDSQIWGAHRTLYRAIGRDGIMIIILLASILGMIGIGRIRDL